MSMNFLIANFPGDLHMKMKMHCVSKNKSMRGYVINLIRNDLERIRTGMQSETQNQEQERIEP